MISRSVNNKLYIMWKEAIVSQLETYQQFLRKWRKSHEPSVSVVGVPVDIETSHLQAEVRIVITWANFSVTVEHIDCSCSSRMYSSELKHCVLCHMDGNVVFIFCLHSNCVEWQERNIIVTRTNVVVCCIFLRLFRKIASKFAQCHQFSVHRKLI
jgi:hypothetical protein